MRFEDCFKKRWPNFTPDEIYSPETAAKYRHKLCPVSMDLLQEFRDFIDAPIYVNVPGHHLRGVRSIAENKSIKGSASESMHICGRAFDVSSTLDIDKLLSAVLDFGKFHGIGVYQTFLHLDNRYLTNWETHAYWEG